MLHYNSLYSVDHGVSPKADRQERSELLPFSVADAILDEEGTSSFDLLFTILEGLGHGAVLINQSGALLHFNQTASKVLECDAGELSGHREQAGLLKNAVTRVVRQCYSNDSQQKKSWSTALRETGRPLAVMQLPDKTNPENTLVILVDLDCALRPAPQALKQLFGLTGAEMKVAQRLALGVAPAELAAELGLSRNTIRTQIASIMAKTHTNRQAELVALLARVSILPHMGI